MRTNASRYPDKREGQKSAKARLVALLYACRPHMLLAFTPESLAATHNVPIKECEYALILAKQKRAGELSWERQ
jgi:hypothetical protein